MWIKTQTGNLIETRKITMGKDNRSLEAEGETIGAYRSTKQAKDKMKEIERAILKGQNIFIIK